MDFGVLGPLEVLDHDRSVQLGGPETAHSAGSPPAESEQTGDSRAPDRCAQNYADAKSIVVEEILARTRAEAGS
jgi:hypothetical protein